MPSGEARRHFCGPAGRLPVSALERFPCKSFIVAQARHRGARYSLRAEVHMGDWFPKQTLGSLPEREQVMLYLRFYEGMTQSEIAKHLGISQMHMSRLLARSLQQLRELAEDA